MTVCSRRHTAHDTCYCVSLRVFLEVLSILAVHASLGENAKSHKKQCSRLISCAFLW